jgi:hypothetical protein
LQLPEFDKIRKFHDNQAIYIDFFNKNIVLCVFNLGRPRQLLGGFSE